MNSRFRKLGVESLEGRSVLSTTAFADFNHDGLLDEAAISGQKTIIVSLAHPDGSFSVSASLTAPKPIDAIEVTDVYSDGTLDIHASGSKQSDNFYWQGNGDGTFNYIEPFRWKHSKWFV